MNFYKYYNPLYEDNNPKQYIIYAIVKISILPLKNNLL